MLALKLQSVVLTSVLLLASQVAESRIIQSVADLQKQYDYIIVGGGTAGCVLANRLSSNFSEKVLVIEAGGSPDDIETITIPFLGVALPGTSVDWNFTTTPQPGLNGRSIPYTRGQVLGGSSSVHLSTWNRGSDDLWDRWANITQDSGWSANSIQPYYLKTSKIVPSADGHDNSGQYVPSAHGNGPVEVSLPGYPTELDDKVINSSKELGGRFPFIVDLNAGNAVGFSWMQSSIGHSKRSSSATAYLNPVLNRTNLDVLINTLATKILPSIGKSLTLNTIEIAGTRAPSGPRTRITAKKELILAAGVINTPQLLLLSGIGPASALLARGIIPILDIPSVGQNLTDHPLIPHYYFVNSNETFDEVLRDPAVFGAVMEQYLTHGQGLFVNSPANTQGYVRLPHGSPILEQFGDPSAGPGSAHMEFIFIDGFAAFGPLSQPAVGNFMSLASAVVSPLSRGNLTLASTNPFDKPLINPAILTSEFDILTAVQSMKDAQTFISSSPWGGFIAAPYGDLATATTDQLKAAYARNFSSTVNHPVGTAAMSPKNANWGVVDPDLTVKGAKRLRIVDASIFPVIPEVHVQAAVYTVAERAANLILNHVYDDDEVLDDN